MKVEKVDIKELWFTEQLLYWNDIKDNRIRQLEEEKKAEREIQLERTIEDLRYAMKWSAIRDIVFWILLLVWSIVYSQNF